MLHDPPVALQARAMEMKDVLSDAQPVLRVENLSIGFAGTAVNVVEGISFSIPAGRTLCLVGESGCGKSVTSLAIMGLLPPKSTRIPNGRAEFHGEDLLQLRRPALEEIRGDRMAMIFQEPMTSLNPAFTVGDQIAEAVRRHRKLSHEAARERALEMFRRVRIPSPETRLDDYPHQLSGGMRQRVMIAMALANDPQLLIADEPTTALDVTIQAQILQLIKDIQAETGMGLIMITHDLGVIAETVDRVVVMYGGKVMETGPVQQIFSAPLHPYTRALLNSIPGQVAGKRRLTEIPGSSPNPVRPPGGCPFHPRCPMAIAACHQVTPPLETKVPGREAACIRVESELVPA